MRKKTVGPVFAQRVQEANLKGKYREIQAELEKAKTIRQSAHETVAQARANLNRTEALVERLEGKLVAIERRATDRALKNLKK